METLKSQGPSLGNGQIKSSSKGVGEKAPLCGTHSLGTDLSFAGYWLCDHEP